MKVFVSIPPQSYFVKRIGGAHVDCDVLVGPGQSPHVFEPSQRQIAGLASARLYFQTGLPFEQRLLEKIRSSMPNLHVVDTTAGIPLRSMSGCTHDHGEGEHHDDHEHAAAGQTDPHVWLSPRLALLQSRTIAAALKDADVAHADEYQQNLTALESDLTRVDARIAASLAPLRGRSFFVFHPAYGYFADAYGLQQVAIEDNGKEPSPRQLIALIEKAKAQNVRLIFVQPQFPSKSAEAVATAIGGAVVPMNDLAEDYLHNLEEMAAKIRRALGNEANPDERVAGGL